MGSDSAGRRGVQSKSSDTPQAGWRMGGRETQEAVKDQLEDSCSNLGMR